MALLFMDGVDHIGTTNILGLGKWADASGADGNTTVKRTGTGSLRIFSSSGYATSRPLSASGGCVVGVAVHNSGASFQVADIIRVREGATDHLVVAVSAAGVLSVKRGPTTLATGTTVLALNSWYYLEFKGVIDDVAGSYELRIDGVTELANAGPIDTRNAGTTGQWDRVMLGPLAPGSASYYDDIYVCDTSGPAPRNTFLGPVKVETLYPQTDAVAAGSNAGLTPSTGTDHGALVDEPTPNTSDYNSSATVGLKDTYNYPSLSLTGTILGIQTNLYVAKSDAAVRQVCAVVRAGGVDYDGANVSPLTTFSYFPEVRAQNPNTTLDWTSADIANLQAGMKVTV